MPSEPEHERLGITRASFLKLRAEHWAVIELAYDPGGESAEALATGAVWNITEWWGRFSHVRELLEGHYDRYIRMIIHCMVHRAHNPPTPVDNPSWLYQASIGDERLADHTEAEAAVLTAPDGSSLLSVDEAKFLHLRLRGRCAKVAGAAWVMGISTNETRAIARTLLVKLHTVWG